MCRPPVCTTTPAIARASSGTVTSRTRRGARSNPRKCCAARERADCTTATLCPLTRRQDLPPYPAAAGLDRAGVDGGRPGPVTTGRPAVPGVAGAGPPPPPPAPGPPPPPRAPPGGPPPPPPPPRPAPPP